MKGLSQLPAAVQQVRTRLYSPNFDVGRFSAELLMAHTAAKALGVARDPFLVIVIFRTNRQTVRQRGGGREGEALSTLLFIPVRPRRRPLRGRIGSICRKTLNFSLMACLALRPR